MQRMLLVCTVAFCFAMAETASAAPTVIPIDQRALSDGTIRFSIPVRIGQGPWIDAMLDTGSSGLRVLGSAVPSYAYQPTTILRDYGFMSGVVFRGPVSMATIGIGDKATSSPVAFQRVDSVFCRNVRPRCPASRLSASAYRMGGDGLPQEGYGALIGLSLHVTRRAVAAGNALPKMGVTRWIISLPRPGASAPGQLTLNPISAEQSQFQTVARWGQGSNPPNVLHVDDLPSCPVRGLVNPALSGPAVFDTGSSQGTPPYFRFDVLYDEDDDLVGLRCRDD